MRAALFVPCYIDAFFPEVAIATLELLERLGVDVAYPLNQTCCAQPMANSGCHDEAAATEAGLAADALAAYAFTTEHYPAERIVLWGESLGSGVAVALAAQQPVGYLILQSPFTSTADVGAHRYWFVPVGLLMKDQFRSDLRIGKVTAPVLVLHGDRDNIVPMASAERLYGLINAPKRFVRFAGVGHNDLGAQAVEAAKQFLGEH